MEHPAIFAVCAFLMLMVILSWVGYRLIYKPGRFMRHLMRGQLAEFFVDQGQQFVGRLVHRAVARGFVRGR